MFPDITCDDIFRIETQRMWLRWLRASDAAAIAAICSLGPVAEMTAAIPHPYPAGEAERFILHARATTASGQALVLALTAKGRARALIGIISAEAAERGEIEIGYLVAPAQAGRGYASEAATALGEAAFNLTQARALVANTRIDNPASRRVLEKCGFRLIGARAHHLPARGAALPCEFFRLERADWLRTAASSAVPRPLPGMAQQAGRKGRASKEQGSGETGHGGAGSGGVLD